MRWVTACSEFFNINAPFIAHTFCFSSVALLKQGSFGLCLPESTASAAATAPNSALPALQVAAAVWG